MKNDTIEEFGYLTLKAMWIYPPWNEQFAPENRPSQKEIHLPTTNFQVLCWFHGKLIED